MRLVPLLGAVVLAAGCGSSSSGRAIVWVTRDRGAHVLHVANVPAGLTAAQGLERVAKVETRYGGRYIRSVDGVEERGERAWFYYVNGYLADRSAAEYRLHAGDVEWWDYRSWKNPAQNPVVVGAFPQPFLNGYGGRRRRALIITAEPNRARELARRLHAKVVTIGQSFPAQDVNVLEILGASPATARLSFIGPTSPGSAVQLTFSGDPKLLLRRWPFRFHYSVR